MSQSVVSHTLTRNKAYAPFPVETRSSIRDGALPVFDKGDFYKRIEAKGGVGCSASALEE